MFHTNNAITNMSVWIKLIVLDKCVYLDFRTVDSFCESDSQNHPLAFLLYSSSFSSHKHLTQSFLYPYSFMVSKFISDFLSWVAFMSTWQRLESFLKSEPQLRKFLLEIALRARMWNIFSLDDWCGRVHHTGGGNICECEVLDGIKKAG